MIFDSEKSKEIFVGQDMRNNHHVMVAAATVSVSYKSQI